MSPALDVATLMQLLIAAHMGATLTNNDAGRYWLNRILTAFTLVVLLGLTMLVHLHAIPGDRVAVCLSLVAWNTYIPYALTLEFGPRVHRGEALLRGMA